MTTNQCDTRIDMEIDTAIDATRTDFIRRYCGNKLNTKINKSKFIIHRKNTKTGEKH